MDGKNKIIVIFGPTASGKTELSLKISEYFDTEIVSADSRQIYKYLNIGTAKPSDSELNAVKHHFINLLEPDKIYSAGQFAKDANNVINEIIKKGKTPLLVGGSGLYIKALCEGFTVLDEDKDKREKIRNQLNREHKLKGKEYLYNKLFEIDEKSAKLYSDKNPRRVIRALEYYYITRKKLSDSFEKKENKNYDCLYFGINFEREELYKRINERTEKMWKTGLIEETENILKMGYPKELNSLNTVGYKEVIEFLENNFTKSQAIEEMKKNTRRYAKRQITWFKKYENAIWLKKNYNIKNVVDIISNKLENEI